MNPLIILYQGMGRKRGRKQRQITKTTPSGLPSDTIEVKLMDEAEEYFHSSLSHIVVNSTLWYDNKFNLLHGYPHMLIHRELGGWTPLVGMSNTR
jgi:hypothetical protein